MGVIRKIWTDGKAKLSKEQLAKIPKEDFGKTADDFEAHCADAIKKLMAADAALHTVWLSGEEGTTSVRHLLEDLQAYSGIPITVDEQALSDVGIDLGAPVTLNLEHQPSFGPADAPVTIVEFGDLQCPSCRAEAPLLRELIPELYPNKVRIVFKDYPLESIHPWARAASIAGRCVFRQNPQAFWKFYDWDYQNQDDTTVENLRSRVLGWARGNGIDSAQLESCIDTKATDAEVAQNISEGKTAGVRGTPTLFVNGVKSASVQLPGLQQTIEKEIAKRGAK